MKRVIQISICFVVVLTICSIIWAQNPESEEESIDALYQQAVELTKAGDYENAFEYWMKIIERDPAHVEAYWVRGQIYALRKEYELAIADTSKVIELNPDLARAYGNLGWYLILQSKFEQAKEPCRKAYELAPENYNWAMNLGHTYLLTGVPETARKYYEKALPLITLEQEFKRGPVADFELFIEKGWQVEACRRELAWMTQEFIKRSHGYIEDDIYIKADTYWFQAKELEAQGRYLEAARLYEKSAEAERATPQPRIMALATQLMAGGFCYSKVEYYDKALACYEQVLEIHRKLGVETEVARDLSMAGWTYHLMGQDTQALNYLEQAVELEYKLGMEAEMAMDLSTIGRICRSMAQYDKALGYYEQTLALNRKLGNDTEIARLLSDIGSVYEAQEQYVKALEYYALDPLLAVVLWGKY